MERPWLAHYDDGVPATLAPYPQQTLVDIVKATAAERPRHTAAIFKGARLSYGELNGLSDAFAAWLAARGVAKGDRKRHTSELQSLAYLVCRLLLEKKKKKNTIVNDRVK